MDILVDVIIPLYNGAKFVDSALQQLENQTYQCFRAIFVDDGSKDNSYQIYFEKLKNVSFPYLLLQKENGGAASARNMGLKNATAKWIAFMDCDDGILPEFIEHFCRAVENTDADLAIGSYQQVIEGEDNNVKNATELNSRIITPSEAMKLYTTEWLGVYCLFMKREMQQKFNLFFDEECIYCEDAPYIAQVIAASTKVAKIENANYLYRMIQGSLSRSGSAHKFLSGMKSFEKMVDEFSLRNEEACKMFLSRGNARYYIAVLRKAAVQLSYTEFKKVANNVPLSKYKNQFKVLNTKFRLAGRLYFISKKMFYSIIRILFND